MKHILTILIMMLALGSYASEPSVTDSISSAEKMDTTTLHAGKVALIMPLIPSLDWDWWQRDYTVQIRMTVFFLLLMSRFMVMSVL